MIPPRATAARVATTRMRRAGAVVALIALAAIGARDAQAQRGTSCATADAPTKDSVTLLLTDRVEPTNAGQLASADYADRIAGEIAARLTIPSPFGMEAYVGHRMPGDDEVHVTGAHLDLDAMYGITLRRDGRVKRAVVLTTSLNPALDREVLAAVHRADSAGVFGPLPTGTTGDSIPLRLVLAASDSARARGTPILRARVPIRHLDRQLAPADSGRPVRYPEGLRARGIPGLVELSFVVDEKGAVIPTTISVRRATDDSFTRAVLAVFPAYRFIPAVVDGCTVPFHGAMPFEFAARR